MSPAVCPQCSARIPWPRLFVAFLWGFPASEVDCAGCGARLRPGPRLRRLAWAGAVAVGIGLGLVAFTGRRDLGWGWTAALTAIVAGALVLVAVLAACARRWPQYEVVRRER